jgi:hypothetical protein
VKIEIKEESLGIFKVAVDGQFNFHIDDSYSGFLNKLEQYIDQGLHPKHAKRKAWGDILGVSRGQFFKMLEGADYKALVMTFGPKVAGIAKRKKVCPNIASKLYMNYQLVKQCIDDGIENVVPIVIMFRQPPSVLKSKLGSVWKSLAKNSLYRNKLIMNHLSFNSSTCYPQFVKVFNALPSTLLDNRNSLHMPFSILSESDAMYITNRCKGAYSNRVVIRSVMTTLTDCDRMLSREGRQVNYNWSLRRLKEEHDEAVKRMNARKLDGLSKTPIAALNGIPEHFEHEGYTARLLKTKYEITQEGMDMHHCVSVYRDQVEDGEYLVYSITDQFGNKYATLGIHITQDEDGARKYHRDQCYKSYNREVDDPAVSVLSLKVIYELNYGY